MTKLCFWWLISLFYSTRLVGCPLSLTSLVGDFNRSWNSQSFDVLIAVSADPIPSWLCSQDPSKIRCQNWRHQFGYHFWLLFSWYSWKSWFHRTCRFWLLLTCDGLRLIWRERLFNSFCIGGELFDSFREKRNFSLVMRTFHLVRRGTFHLVSRWTFHLVSRWTFHLVRGTFR